MILTVSFPILLLLLLVDLSSLTQLLVPMPREEVERVVLVGRPIGGDAVEGATKLKYL